MTAPDRGATYQIALASTGLSTHDAWYRVEGALITAERRFEFVALEIGCAP
jgi:hypothetical protein